MPASLSWAMLEPQAEAEVPRIPRHTDVVHNQACQAVAICLSQPSRTQIGLVLRPYSNYARADDVCFTLKCITESQM